MVSKMSARPDPPVSPARWENSDQTPSGNTCCYLENTKLTCVDRFMSRQIKWYHQVHRLQSKGTSSENFCDNFYYWHFKEYCPVMDYKRLCIKISLMTHQILLHQFQSNRFWCFLEFGCTFPRTAVLLNVARFSVFLHKLAALLLLPYEYVPRPAPGVSRLERPDGRR